MEIRITVKYHSDPRTGAGKLRATGAGRQATIAYPHELHSSMKYWAAAEELVRKLERKNDDRLRLIRRTFNADNSDTFVFDVFNATVPRTWNNREAVKYGRV